MHTVCIFHIAPERPNVYRLVMEEQQRLPKPAEVNRRCPFLSARNVTLWFNGYRRPTPNNMDRILVAFPEMDARWFVHELATKWDRRQSGA
jgi:hypothetical protein